MPKAPYAEPILATDPVELVGPDERVSNGCLSDDALVALNTPPTCGEILAVALTATEGGATGTVFAGACQLIIFAADPAITLNDATLSEGARLQILGIVDVAAGDWRDDAGSATAHKRVQLPFGLTTQLYLALRNLSGGDLNDGATDEERLRARLWLRREA